MTNLSEFLFWGLLLHLIGDYLFQNNWMAQKKTKYIWVAIIHGTIYSLPFLLLVQDAAWLMIWSTHIIIDRLRLAEYWIRMVNWSWKKDNYGYGDSLPKWLGTTLLIVVDNTFHILINSFVIWKSLQ